MRSVIQAAKGRCLRFSMSEQIQIDGGGPFLTWVSGTSAAAELDGDLVLYLAGVEDAHAAADKALELLRPFLVELLGHEALEHDQEVPRA